ncbi:MAG TPA: UTP--glucose-1-phosphate uridylyltransferase [bacterium]|nr:UTP--glucose-1-phosphate uridylyltransferase [bacterium]
MSKIKKAIIPIAGLATRFLPLSKVVPKEFLPLVDKPTIHYVIEEAINSGIKEVIFITNPGKGKNVLKYFQTDSNLEKILKEREKDQFLKELQSLKSLFKNVTFSFVPQKEQLGDGHAILQAKNLIKRDNCAVLFPDDVIDSKTPCLLQLQKIFNTCEKPIVALKRIPKESIPHYGVIDGEPITSRLYKIKNVVEKPSQDSAPSDLAIIGRYILTPEVFDSLKKVRPSKKKEIILADALRDLAQSGKIVYGYDIDGKWLDCGDKLRWLKANLYLSLKHPQFGPELRKYYEKNH